MKAIRLLEYGGQLVFDDSPTPPLARDEILVKIKSTAVNHLDLVKASGKARQVLSIDLPWIPGHEFSGIVERIGLRMATQLQVPLHAVDIWVQRSPHELPEEECDQARRWMRTPEGEIREHYASAVFEHAE